MNSIGLQVTEADRTAFAARPMVGRHNLHQRNLFTNESLAQLLDAFPRENLYAWATGTDPERLEENRLALDTGVAGRDLLRAIEKGRFWVNVTRVDQVDHRYRLLVDELYESLRDVCPGFHPDGTQASLVISSPRAVVYLHSDAPPMVLWHLRGRKRVWVYPLEERFVSQEQLEDIFANAAHEYLPYRRTFDPDGVSFELGPGQWAAWPQNAPHRVVNIDGLNVAISSEHFTPESRRRARVYCANRFLRTTFGYRARSTRPSTLAAIGKVGVHRIARALGFDREPAVKRIVPTLRVDPDAPLGCIQLDKPAEAR